MASISEIQIEGIKKLPTKTIGVYFLCNNDDEILYIGQSWNILARVGHHLWQKQGIAKVYYIEVDGQLLNSVESKLIARFKPELNKTFILHSKSCFYCGKELPPPKVSPARKYCNSYCRNRNWIDRKTQGEDLTKNFKG